MCGLMTNSGEHDRNGPRREKRDPVAAEKREILNTLLIVNTKLRELRQKPEFRAACDEVTCLLQDEIARLD